MTDMATIPRTPEKDPADVLDYTVDWQADAWLGTDTINTSTFIVPNGITIGNGANGAPSPTNTATTATAWFIGGTSLVDYLITNRITTGGGRTADRSFTIPVRER